MIMLKVISGILLGLLGLITFGFACLGASYFIDNVEAYEEESKYFTDDN